MTDDYLDVDSWDIDEFDPTCINIDQDVPPQRIVGTIKSSDIPIIYDLIKHTEDMKEQQVSIPKSVYDALEKIRFNADSIDYDVLVKHVSDDHSEIITLHIIGTKHG